MLQAEDCSGVGGFVESMFAQRYGLSGLGLAYPGGPGPEHLSDEAIAAHARRWFVAENAALVCHGELPTGLRLDLPRGPRPAHEVARRREQGGPAWTKSWSPGVGLMVSVDGPWDAALLIAFDVVQERTRDVARIERGLSYSSGVVRQEVDRDRRELVLAVDAREGQEGAVAAVLWEQWRSLCENGPSEAEVAHALAATQEEFEGADEDDLLLGDLTEAAVCRVLDRDHVSNEHIRTAFAAVTAEQVRDAARSVWPTALLQVPEWSEFAGLPGMSRWWVCNQTKDVPGGRVLKPSPLVRLIPGAAVKKRRVVLADRGVAHVDEDGDVHLVTWDRLDSVYRQPSVTDAAGKVVDGGGLVIVGSDLCMFRVDEDAFGAKAVAAATAHVSGNVSPDRWISVRPTRAGRP